MNQTAAREDATRTAFLWAGSNWDTGSCRVTQTEFLAYEIHGLQQYQYTVQVTCTGEPLRMRWLAERGARLLRPSYRNRTPRPGEHLLKPVRRLIESVNDTLASSTWNCTVAAASKASVGRS